MFYTIIVILVVLASVLMCGIVFIQESKGGGLASGFSSGNSMLGVRKTTDVVEKTTWGLAIAMVVLSILSVFFLGGQSVNANQSVTEMQEGAVMEQAAGAANQNAIPQTTTPAQEEESSAPTEDTTAPAESAE